MLGEHQKRVREAIVQIRYRWDYAIVETLAATLIDAIQASCQNTLGAERLSPPSPPPPPPIIPHTTVPTKLTRCLPANINLYNGKKYSTLGQA